MRKRQLGWEHHRMFLSLEVSPDKSISQRLVVSCG